MTVLFEAATPAELSHQLATLDIVVPLRSEGRTKKHTERYALRQLLSAVPFHRLPFPVSVIHGDRPDFVLSGPNFAIGVEHTEAIPNNEAHAQTIRESGAGPDVYFLQPADPGEPVKKGKRLRREIEANEMGAGWVGDACEREWANAMVHFALRKLKKATAPGFSRYDINWLLIYDNWTTTGVDYASAFKLLSELLAPTSVLDTFDCLFVLCPRGLCEVRSPSLVHSAESSASEIRQPPVGG